MQTFKSTSALTWMLVSCVCFAAGAVLPVKALAQAFQPDDDTLVVATLSGAVVSLSKQIRANEKADESVNTAAGSTSDTDRLIIQIVDAYRLATSSQEARAYGRVMAMLEQWPDALEQPALLHIIKASVLQHNHNFSQALSELDNVLYASQPVLDPETRQLHNQAHMIRAQIGLVTADFDLTRQSCAALENTVQPAVYLNCQAQLDGVTGQAEQALAAVRDALGNNRHMAVQDQIELKITAATLAHRLGDTTTAQNYYRQVLVQSPQNFYTLVNYSNLLLEQNRAQELISLQQLYPEETRSTELNILLAEALMAAGNTDAAEVIIQQLQQAFELSFLRHEAIPYKDYARYSITLKPQAEQALDAALHNWEEQKEPSDALLLARAAVFSGDNDVLNTLQRWVEQNAIQDTRLADIFAEQASR